MDSLRLLQKTELKHDFLVFSSWPQLIRFYPSCTKAMSIDRYDNPCRKRVVIIYLSLTNVLFPDVRLTSVSCLRRGPGFFIPFLHCLVFLQQPCDFVIRLRFLLMLMVINSILGDSEIPTYRLCNLCKVYWGQTAEIQYHCRFTPSRGLGYRSYF